MNLRLRLLLCLAAMSAAYAAENQVDLGEMMKETQKQEVGGGKVRIVWWIPNEYWRSAIGNNPNVSPAIVTQMEESTKGYLIFGVVDATINPLGSMKFTDRAVIDAASSVKIGERVLAAIAPEEQPDDLRNMLAGIAPVLKNSMGKLGENFQFLVFPATDDTDKPFIAPGTDATLAFAFNASTYTWHLPLGCLLPKLACPKCSESYPGNYKFCPFDGSELAAKP